MRLGFAVKVLGIGSHPPLPSHDTRRWRSGPHLSVSLDRLAAILEYLDETDVRAYRMATALAPYASHPDLPQFRDQPRAGAPRLPAGGAPPAAPRPAARGRRGAPRRRPPPPRARHPPDQPPRPVHGAELREPGDHAP